VPSTSAVVPAFRLNPAIAAIFAGVPVVPAEAEGKAARQPATQMMGKARHHSKHVRVGQGEASNKQTTGALVPKCRAARLRLPVVPPGMGRWACRCPPQRRTRELFSLALDVSLPASPLTITERGQVGFYVGVLTRTKPPQISQPSRPSAVKRAGAACRTQDHLSASPRV
jgi:hypothetical protein